MVLKSCEVATHVLHTELWAATLGGYESRVVLLNTSTGHRSQPRTDADVVVTLKEGCQKRKIPA